MAKISDNKNLDDLKKAIEELEQMGVFLSGINIGLENQVKELNKNIMGLVTYCGQI